jgi:hypothetical protein
MLTGLSGCVNPQPTMTAEQLTRYAWFLGGWSNRDRDTHHMTRVHLYRAETGLQARIWGRCAGKQCDWGAVPVEPGSDAETLTLVWRLSYVIRTQTLYRMGESLVVSTHSRFLDGVRQDRTLVDHFDRGMDRDWGPVVRKVFK